MVKLSKRVVILNKASESDTSIFFLEPPDDDDPKNPRESHSLKRFDWEDFGMPEVITVTIEPGDKLNA